MLIVALRLVGFQPSIDQARHNLLSMVSTLTRLRGLGEI